MKISALDRITVDPAQCDGKPCIRGLRIPVHLVLRLLASGKTPAEIIADYPNSKKKTFIKLWNMQLGWLLRKPS